MKKCFYSLLFFTFFGFLMTSEVKSQTQELVKPVPNKGVKKAETKTTNTSGNVVLQSSDPNATTKAEAEGVVPVVKSGHVESNPYKVQNDSPEYQNKKAEWIKNNPEKYKAISGNPNLTILTEEQLNAFSSEEQARILADEANYLIIR